MDRLLDGKSQVFVPTHSPSAISAASGASLWYIDHAGKIGQLASEEITRHRQSDPETLLAWLAVVAEGSTELGFVSALLEKALDCSLQQYGVHVTDGEGHESTLGAVLKRLPAGGYVSEDSPRTKGSIRNVGRASRRSSAICFFSGNLNVSSKTLLGSCPTTSWKRC
jgi:putative ATP-dependent endonuclease of OLD family